MNTKQLILAATVFAAAGAAFADAPEQYVDHSRFVGTKTRAEVRAELNNAAPTETLARGNQVVDFSNVATSGKTRAEVRAELNNAAPTETLARGNQYVDFSNVASTRTREEVRAEAVRSARNNEHLIGG
ncbi:DUF4148 domain-containing protein [Oxalobacteraceae bacterium OM1]|nr:DUF4148 domain-containing protein [Oxalobacteraceae bacterium OM1]